MTIRFQRSGFFMAPDRIRVRLQSPSMIEAALLDPANWELSRYAEGLWGTPLQGERLLSVHAEANTGTPSFLEFVFAGLAGIYRLSIDHSEIDSEYNTVYFRHDAATQPLYLTIEGLQLNGANLVAAYYLDQQYLPNSLSQHIDPKAGISTCGGLQINLADLDGALTSAFAPRQAETLARLLSEDVSESSTSVTLNSCDGFASSGVAYVGHEAIRYTGLSGQTLTGCERGVLGTEAAAHRCGARVWPSNPYWRNRLMKVRKALGTDYSTDDPVLFAGFIDSVSPSADNLATFSISSSDPLSRLNSRIGRRMGRSSIFPVLMLHGQRDGSGRAGNDTIYFRHCAFPGLPWSHVSVSLPPGAYLSDIDSIGHPRNIATVLQRVFYEQAPELQAEFTITADGNIQLRVLVGFLFQLVVDGSEQQRRDSIWPSLGFETEQGKLYQNQDYYSELPDSVYAEITANQAIATGIGPFNRRIYLQPETLPGSTQHLLSTGHVVRIEDEYIYYDSLQLTDSNASISSTLAQAIDAEEDVIYLADSSGFPARGGIIQIDSETILYERSVDGSRLINCYRGAWGSAAASHNSLATVTLTPLPYLDDCVRGLYQTTACAHSGGVLVEEIWSSDRFYYISSGLLRIFNAQPIEFLHDLLDGSRPNSLYGLTLPEDLIDTESLQRLAIDYAVSGGNSFRVLVLPEQSYRDVIEDICRSFGFHLFANRAGQIAASRFYPKLAHESADLDITHATLVQAPQIQWREDLRINRVELQLDYDPTSEEFGSKVIIDDDSTSDSIYFDDDDHTLSIDSHCLQSTRNGLLDGDGEGIAYDLSWRWIRQYNRFLTSAQAAVFSSCAWQLGLFGRVQLSSSLLPGGSGSRGISNVIYDIVELEVDLAEHVTRLGLLERGLANYGGIAPVATIDSWDETMKRLTIVHDDFWPEDAKPGDIYNSGDRLCVKRIRNLQTGTYTVSDPLTVALDGIDDSLWETAQLATLTFNELPGFSPQSGDLLLPCEYDEHESSTGILQLFVYLADTDTHLGLNNAAAYQYSF